MGLNAEQFEKWISIDDGVDVVDVREIFPPKQRCSNIFVLYMSRNKCAVLYYIFCLYSSNFRSAGCKIRRAINPKMLDTEMDSLIRVCCILKNMIFVVTVLGFAISRQRMFLRILSLVYAEAKRSLRQSQN